MPPTVTVTNGIVCTGDCFRITASASGRGNTFLWSNGATTDTTTVCPTSTTIYTVTVKDTCGDSVIKSGTVIVYAVTLYACCDTTINLGGHATLIGYGARSYSWSPSVTMINLIGDTVIATPSVTTTYTVTGYDSNGCIAKRMIVVVVGPNAIPFISGIGYVNIYPNPSATAFNLNLPKPALIEVYDITGRLLLCEKEKSGENKFGEELSPGMYFLVVDGKQGMKVVKI